VLRLSFSLTEQLVRVVTVQHIVLTAGSSVRVLSLLNLSTKMVSKKAVAAKRYVAIEVLLVMVLASCTVTQVASLRRACLSLLRRDPLRELDRRFVRLPRLWRI